MNRIEIETAIEDIIESKLAWESLQQYLIRIAQGDHSAAEQIEDLIKNKIEFNREQAPDSEGYPSYFNEEEAS